MKKKILSVLLIATMICAALPTFTFAGVQTFNVHNSATLQLEKPAVSGDATWKSSNKKVATVNKEGVVTGKKAGTCTITAKVGKTTVKYKVKVPSYYEGFKSIPDFGALFGLKNTYDEGLIDGIETSGDAVSEDASSTDDEDSLGDLIDDVLDMMNFGTYYAKNAKKAKALMKNYEKRLKKAKFKLESKTWQRTGNITVKTWQKGNNYVSTTVSGKEIDIVYMDMSDF